MDGFSALEASTALLRTILAGVTPSQWHMPSTCSGWSVREVANHVIGGAYVYSQMLEGATYESLAASRSLDYVGDRAPSSLDEYQSRLDALFQMPGALERVVLHPAGDMTGAELLYYRVIEQTLHGWDIARSVGGETNIDEALCEYILSGHDTIERLRGQRLFGPTTLSNDDSALSRLLSLTGRT